VSRPGTLVWFAQHEFRLAWRDWLSMVTAGGRTRVRTVAIALLVFAAVMHVIAYGMVARYADLAIDPDKTALAVITGSALLALSLMLSQAMESVTRAFYTRSDLDLLLSSPAQTPKIFAVRIATIALSVMAMAGLLAGPFINVLAVEGGRIGSAPTAPSPPWVRPRRRSQSG
jgi:ABC-2 type transport system permease protein